MRCNAEFYYVGKISPIGIAATRGFTTVLFAANRRNNFVGGTCALPSALLVPIPFIFFTDQFKTVISSRKIRLLSLYIVQPINLLMSTL